MIFTTIRVERPAGTVLQRGVPVQIEAANGDGEHLDFADARRMISSGSTPLRASR
jgi:hypothetical protein